MRTSPCCAHFHWSLCVALWPKRSASIMFTRVFLARMRCNLNALHTAHETTNRILIVYTCTAVVQRHMDVTTAHDMLCCHNTLSTRTHHSTEGSPTLGIMYLRTVRNGPCQQQHQPFQTAIRFSFVISKPTLCKNTSLQWSAHTPPSLIYSSSLFNRPY